VLLVNWKKSWDTFFGLSMIVRTVVIKLVGMRFVVLNRLIRAMNKALKTKWLSRYAIEGDALWKKVILFKYGADSFV